MLYGCDFVNGHEIFNDHINKFEFTYYRPVFLLEFFSFLNHELLYIIISFIGQF